MKVVFGKMTFKLSKFLRLTSALLCIMIMLGACASKKAAVGEQQPPQEMAKWAAEEWAREECADEETGIVAENGAVADPLEPLNRFFFAFNDKMYFWVLKPVAQSYSYVVPENVRGCIRNAARNILMPIRLVGNLMQGKIQNSGIEVARFVINSTIGIYGLADPAKEEFGLEAKDEDFGQTLGKYGLGDIMYICWPVFGPSNVRDTIGRVGDGFLNPLSYMLPYNETYGIASQTVLRINDTSLTLGTYEQFKESSFDPYIAVRDAYKQHRDSKIRDTTTMQSGVVYTEKGVCLPLDQ